MNTNPQILYIKHFEGMTRSRTQEECSRHLVVLSTVIDQSTTQEQHSMIKKGLECILEGSLSVVEYSFNFFTCLVEAKLSTMKVHLKSLIIVLLDKFKSDNLQIRNMSSTLFNKILQNYPNELIYNYCKNTFANKNLRIARILIECFTENFLNSPHSFPFSKYLSTILSLVNTKNFLQLQNEIFNTVSQLYKYSPSAVDSRCRVVINDRNILISLQSEFKKIKVVAKEKQIRINHQKRMLKKFSKNKMNKKALKRTKIKQPQSQMKNSKDSTKGDKKSNLNRPMRIKKKFTTQKRMGDIGKRDGEMRFQIGK
eukprot:Anaeramoba_flamelloidesa809746_29.p1 GENE.a809746_29~~a809746_29.p1  ORF type:complete len:312 (+),score=68.29 a809746_29:88-1023(+)